MGDSFSYLLDKRLRPHILAKYLLAFHGGHTDVSQELAGFNFPTINSLLHS